TFRGHTGLLGASAFLVRDQGGRIFAATAKHLLGSAGGVRPEVKVEKFDSVLLGWKLHPRTRKDETVSIDRAEFAGGDVLVLSVKPQKEPLPAIPLPLRDEPARVGEQIYVLGCPYSEGGCQQNVYSGKVALRVSSSFFF